MEKLALSQVPPDRLRAELRQRFDRSELSDGAIKGIARHIAERGVPAHPRELLYVGGVTERVVSILLERLEFAPAATASGPQIRLLLSPHGDETKGKFDEYPATLTAEELATLPAGEPVVIAHEVGDYTNGEGADALYDSMTQHLLQSLTEILGSKADFLAALCDRLGSGRERLLNDLFRTFRKGVLARDPDPVARLRSFPGGRKFESLVRSERAARRVLIQYEDPPFESWIDRLRERALAMRAAEAMKRFDGDAALRDLGTALSFCRAADVRRDRKFVGDLRINPHVTAGATVLMPRGTGHDYSMSEAFREAGFEFAVRSLGPTALEVTGPSQLYMAEGCPPVSTSRGRALLIGAFLWRTLRILDPGVQQRIGAVQRLLALSADDLEEWFELFFDDGRSGRSQALLWMRGKLEVKIAL